MDAALEQVLRDVETDGYKTGDVELPDWAAIFTQEAACIVIDGPVTYLDGVDDGLINTTQQLRIIQGGSRG